MKALGPILLSLLLASCGTTKPVAISQAPESQKRSQLQSESSPEQQPQPPYNYSLRMAWELDVPHKWVMAWDANTETDLAGYKLRYGTTSGSYTMILDVGNVTEWELMLPCVPPTYVAVNAYNTSGMEGPLSDEYIVTGRDLRLTWDYPYPGTFFLVWRSPDLESWVLAREVSVPNALLRVIPKELNKEFYRVSVKAPVL